MCTRLAPALFLASAVAPMFIAFLARILPKSEVRSFLQRFFGYAITGVIKEHALLLLLGSGANGKSTLLEILHHVLGTYARTAPSDLLLERRHGGSRETELLCLWRARLVLASETRLGAGFDESLVKTITGGDRIAARALYRDGFEFSPSHKIVLSTNNKPAIRETSEAIWRRMHLVPFDVMIPEQERDRDLAAKIIDREGPGVLRWLVDGCLEWQRTGLQPPEAVRAASAEYRAESDVLGRFIDERCSVDLVRLTLRARASELFAAYCRWAEEEGERELSQTEFGRSLRERGFERRKTAGGRQTYFGIGLRFDAAGGAEGSGDADRGGGPGTRGTVGTPYGAPFAKPEPSPSSSSTVPNAPHPPQDPLEQIDLSDLGKPSRW